MDPIHVLVIDADPSQSAHLGSLLDGADHGFAIERTADVESAVEVLSEQQHDICLVACEEPELALIRALAGPTPVVLLAGRSADGNDVEAVDAGAADVLVRRETNRAQLTRRLRLAVARHRVHRSLRESTNRYQVAISGADVGLWDWDLVTGEVQYTRRWLSLVGVAPADVRHRPAEWFERIHPDDVCDVSTAMARHFDGKSAQFISEHRLRRSDGTWRWMHVRGRAVPDQTGRLVRFAGSMTDVHSRKHSERLLRERAFRDELTGIYNKRFFSERIVAAFASAKRHGYPLTLCICDIDHFKSVNDTHGHSMGDDVIATFGRLLADSLRVEDIPARYGGDEFCVIMPHTTADQAAYAVERIRKRVQDLVFQGASGAVVNITATFGLVQLSDGHADARDLLEAADAALYEAKRQGRNRTAIATTHR